MRDIYSEISLNNERDQDFSLVCDEQTVLPSTLVHLTNLGTFYFHTVTKHTFLGPTLNRLMRWYMNYNLHVEW